MFPISAKNFLAFLHKFSQVRTPFNSGISRFEKRKTAMNFIFFVCVSGDTKSGAEQ